jgi:hypothetical protein
MKTIFKTLALGLLLMSVASCEKHDPFDENTFTGAVGPEAYWEVASSIVKAGGAMNFEGKYYSIVADIDHSEVWYDLWEQEDKLVTASLIKAFTFSETSSIPTQKRILQTIQSYKHDSTMWSDSLRAYYIADKFPVSFTLSPVAWVQPKDTNGFTKNLHQYFGETYAQGFKKRLTEKMNPSADERNFAAYKNVIDGLGLLRDTILTPNGDRMIRSRWMTDSTFDANSNSFVKHFKQYDTIWSKTNFDTLGFVWDSAYVGRPPRLEYFKVWITKPWVDTVNYVYPQIKQAVDSVWENHVTFYDLIAGSEGYSIEFKREYYINAELRVYDVEGNYSKTDSKKISIN